MKVNKLDLFIFGVMTIIVVLCMAFITMNDIDLASKYETPIEVEKAMNKQLERVEELLKKIDKKYIGEVDYDKLGSGALAGIMYMVDDPYSRYMTKEDFEKQVTPSDDEYVGIGIVVSFDEKNKGGYISSITPDSPAANGGLWIEDLIKKVDNIEILDEDSYYEAINCLKGAENTKVKVDFVRDGKDMTVELTRKKITSKTVTSNVFGDVGYIRIYSFDFYVYNEFKKVYTELEDKGIKKLIIDVRNNGGGLVDETVNIVDLLAPDNEVILTTKYKFKNDVVKKSKDGRKTNMDVIVLVNEHTASASEILASSLKDLGVAKLMGEKTYGKGVVQTYEPLTEGDGIALTFAEYFTKSNTGIHKIGLTPDIEFISPSLEKRLIVSTPDNDTMLKKAIEELNK